MFFNYLPVYNAEKHLKNYWKILNQIFNDFELIINDGSTDSSSKIISSFNDARIKNLEITNSGGPKKSRNRSLAKGKWISFIDSDDIWDKRKLNILYKKICKKIWHDYSWNRIN